MVGRSAATAETGSSGLVLLIVAALLAVFFLVPRIVDPDFGTEEPPWGERATVAVQEPGEADSEPTSDAGDAATDWAESWAEVDRTDPAEVLRDAIADSVLHITPHIVGVEATGAECDDVRLEAGERTVTCFAEYGDLRMRYEVAIEDLKIPPAGGLMTWYQSEVASDVIVTQESLNEAFWTHLGETGRRDEDQELRCDRVPEPVVVGTDQLNRYRCYRRPPGVGSSRVYFLTLSGRLSFEPWSGVHPRNADSWRPSE
jgi:hypothetical protein